MAGSRPSTRASCLGASLREGPPGSTCLASALKSQAVVPAGNGTDLSSCADAPSKVNAASPSATDIQINQRLIMAASRQRSSAVRVNQNGPGLNAPGYATACSRGTQLHASPS